MYRMKNKKATRSHKRGFVVPSQDEWVKAAYYDKSGGGTFSYWKYPTNPGVFGDGSATAPAQSTLDFSTGDVTNAATQPLATFPPRTKPPAPNWCPPDAQTAADECSTANPFGINPITYADIYQGSLGSVGQAETLSPWGTLDQGGNAVEWTDTITLTALGPQRRPRLAPPARRHLQRAGVPDVALGRRPAAAGQHLLRPHLPLARLPDRRRRQAQGEAVAL